MAEPATESEAGRTTADPDAAWQSRAVLTWASALWVGFVLGYMLLPSLRGTASGLSKAIDVISIVDAVFAQALGLFGMMLVVHLELLLLRSKRALLLRVASVPTTAVVITLMMNASVDALDPRALLVLCASSALLALAVGCAALLHGETRLSSLGRFLLGAGAAAALSTGARWAVMAGVAEGSALASTTLSRALATGSSVVSFGLTALALFLLARNSKQGRLWLGLVLCTALLASFLGTRLASPDAPYAQVLLSRAAASLARPPLPFVPDAMVIFAELAGVGAALWALANTALSPSTRVIVGLSLFALRAPDVPLLSLSLAIAALVGAVIVSLSETRTAATPSAPDESRAS